MPVIENITQHKLLLDTHVWIWLMSGEKKLSEDFKKGVDLAAKNGRVFISAISVWEFGMLVEKDRIKIEMDTLDWVEQSLDILGTDVHQISARVAIESSRLPGEIHGDPADRIFFPSSQNLPLTQLHLK